MSVQRKLLLGAIEIINKQLEILKDAGIEVHDAEDFDFAIDYVRYSDASDSVTAYFTRAVGGEHELEEEFEERKEEHERELRRAV